MSHATFAIDRHGHAHVTYRVGGRTKVLTASGAINARAATDHGAPLDSYGRNIYVDTFDSRYGTGSHRENSFLTHHRGKTLGDFCYGFFPHGSHPPGEGTK